jgi:hypothetical protein
VEADRSTQIPEKPPVDPGCLPAWEMDEMPAPVPFENRNLLALIGPGIVLAGASLGTGEWAIGSAVAALYRGALLWVAPVAILCQVMLNTEVMRYTLLTGEPMFTGFMRSKPSGTSCSIAFPGGPRSPDSPRRSCFSQSSVWDPKPRIRCASEL